MENGFISKNILKNWVKLAEARGIETSSIIQHLNISDKDPVIKFEQFALFVEWILEKKGGYQFGFVLGEQSNMTALDIVSQLIQSNRTIEDALEQDSKIFNLMSNVLRLDFKMIENQALLIFNMEESTCEKYPEVCEQLLITSMIFSYLKIAYLTFKQQRPLKVELSFKPSNYEQIADFFNCDIEFNSKQNAIIFDKEMMEKKIVFSDFELILHLQKFVCERLKKQERELSSFSDSIKLIIYNLLNPNFPGIKMVARQLNISERHIQRKLKKEGTTYSNLAIEIKKSMSQVFLKKNLSTREVSFLLGYSEPSTFVSAFKLWYNISPQNFK
ncbi:AraC family transcriptional regulator [Wenyingzhuangia sp. 2_MG-2023]|uniref:AraC family transcriptional regulator n=1 Tax=Wenyingzhuangia sp. 2_MG-2023 TaxID=3062639 RepID=UPI0026E4573A|nr:AraC family transcriptional regulator [Wenyingzhuangia sp. 2_MG-2023]MDO6737980.1 AraC family transcriptional regulator ligand-binding domain-containing protein [Wenyingzhuangia sp. 2_MG-2023]